MVTEQQRNWSLVLPPDDRGGDRGTGGNRVTQRLQMGGRPEVVSAQRVGVGERADMWEGAQWVPRATIAQREWSAGLQRPQVWDFSCS